MITSPSVPDFLSNCNNPRRAGAIWGSLIGDALAMPVHWYYNRAELQRDFGVVRDFVAPKHPHPGSILWRSHYQAPNARGDILREQALYWGQRGVHYHQFLRPGENTLNLQLAKMLAISITENGRYDADDYLQRYIAFMLEPGHHRDTYVEEFHRHFFTQYANGKNPRKCGLLDIHVGGLAHVGILTAILNCNEDETLAAVREHVALTHHGPSVSSAAEALCRMLMDLFSGADLRKTIHRHGSDWLSASQAARWTEMEDATVVGQKLSPACYLPDAFTASLYFAWKYADKPEEGLVANTNVGGDNCHRGAVLGALLGAASSTEGWPARWREHLVFDSALLQEEH